MELKQLLGASFDCECGRHHVVPIEDVIYHQDAFRSIPALIRKITAKQRCLVIADPRTFVIAGMEIAEILKTDGFKVECFVVPDCGAESPVADDRTRDLLLAETCQADLYLAVGSGVINDLVKWLAHLRERPYIAVATAASMNGYGSANVAATMDGLKTLIEATAPKAVVARTDIIINAPPELSGAGLGDVLAKPVSSADWKLNQFLFKDYYCQFSVDLLKNLEPVYLDNPQKIRDREEQGFEALFMALFYSSVAMTVTGTSAPASGAEHLISHTLDILAGRDRLTHDLHGRQVGVSAILMAALYERVLAIDTPVFSTPPKQVDETFWGELTPLVESEYQKKLPRMDQAITILTRPHTWNALRSHLAPHLIPAWKLKQCLETAGAAHRYADIRFNQLPLSRDFLVDVVCHANQMRSRFTILDLAAMLGILEVELESHVERWLA